jgi:hypothetical protein
MYGMIEYRSEGGNNEDVRAVTYIVLRSPVRMRRIEMEGIKRESY